MLILRFTMGLGKGLKVRGVSLPTGMLFMCMTVLQERYTSLHGSVHLLCHCVMKFKWRTLVIKSGQRR